MATGKYINIQNQVIKEYNVTISDVCIKGYNSRTHAHIKERTICKWRQANSIASTFELLHEIGHIETTTSKMRRCEEEYFATKWALKKAEELGLEVPGKIIDIYQDYIDRELSRGIRRGGIGYSKEAMRLSRRFEL